MSEVGYPAPVNEHHALLAQTDFDERCIAAIEAWVAARLADPVAVRWDELSGSLMDWLRPVLRLHIVDVLVFDMRVTHHIERALGLVRAAYPPQVKLVDADG